MSANCSRWLAKCVGNENPTPFLSFSPVILLIYARLKKEVLLSDLGIYAFFIRINGVRTQNVRAQVLNCARHFWCLSDCRCQRTIVTLLWNLWTILHHKKSLRNCVRLFHLILALLQKLRKKATKSFRLKYARTISVLRHSLPTSISKVYSLTLTIAELCYNLLLYSKGQKLWPVLQIYCQFMLTTFARNFPETQKKIKKESGISCIEFKT